jgi:putative Holliday junction resolvase
VRPDNPKEAVGVDVGSVRFGLARGSTIAKLAEPLKTVPAIKAIEEIRKLNPDLIVIGLPRSLDGNETGQTAYVRDWVRAAKQTIDKPFFWQDEALTSKAADSSDSQAGRDAAAAAILLQDFLDTPESEWVRC